MKNRWIHWIGILALSGGLWACEPQPEQATEPPPAKVVYLVRHAEKDLQDTTANPPLTAVGEARALALAERLADSGLTRIFSTTYDRNRYTVQPLAARLALAIEPYEWHAWQPVLDSIAAAPVGSRVLICGHGDNLLPMIEALGADRPLDSLGHHEYDKLFRVALGPDSSEVQVAVFEPQSLESEAAQPAQ